MRQQNILAMDAAFGAVCAVLIRRDGKQFDAVSQSDKPHSQTILPLLQALLADAELGWSDLQYLALGAGPGSFTGLRVVAATMAGINTGLHLPLLEFSSLAVTAWQSNVREPVRVIEDARAGSAWTGYYREGMAVEEDQGMSWDEVRHLPAGIYLSQSPSEFDLPGWKRMPFDRQRCEALAMIARQQVINVEHPHDLPRFPSPRYLAVSQAERNHHSALS